MSPADSAYAARPLFGVRDAVIAASFVGGTIILFPFDKRMAHYLEDEETQANKFFGKAATGFEVIASPGAYIIGGGMYIIGRVGNYGRLQDLGLHGTEAVLVGDAVAGLIKGLAGRARPYVSLDTNPRDFKFGHGFTTTDRQSFPSGHTTTAFAAAAAVTSETGRWWPGSTKYIGPLMYGGATMVGLSRMYHNKHWASDVALGAAIGTFAGQKVAQYNHSHPDNWIDRMLLHVSLAPNGNGGAAVGYSMGLP
ncbi:MAG: phosphoesterase PA-phosphatase related protein [Gemmatimonadetes bacterium]|nr:phosphoesterase PA-phosphatase related protein [Gemmatimonadota bacterium]